MTLTKEDIAALHSQGISKEKLEEQLAIFKQGIPFADLRDPAIVGDGIYTCNQQEQEQLVSLFNHKKETLELLKFTPASGAATRMFKFLFKFLKEYSPEKETVNAYINKTNAQDVRLFFVGLDSFPFYEEVRQKLHDKYPEEEQNNIDLNRYRFVQMMLDSEELNFGNTPKGLFPFHRYKHHNATAFEEHLFEAALYANTKGVAKLHFTISQEHHDAFKTQFLDCKEKIEARTQTIFDITYSFQKSTTNTIAVSKENIPIRKPDGNLCLRPGGHGSLIENLNEQEADIIFIKNIDNVVVAKYEEDVAFYKKMLAGKLLQLQAESFKYLKTIDSLELDEKTILEIVNFLQNVFSLKLASDFEKFSTKYQIEYLREQLDKPIRVCGMVQNEGEPGGGPFWVKHESGKISLQIIESVQIDPKNERQQKVKAASTHFNPVDIVCGVKDYKGNKYDLTQFIDKKAPFITHKTLQGKPIKALEHPGLWNGAMAHWNTLFIEVPIITFNPVKTVNDLLKPAHQVR